MALPFPIVGLACEKSHVLLQVNAFFAISIVFGGRRFDALRPNTKGIGNTMRRVAPISCEQGGSVSVID